MIRNSLAAVLAAAVGAFLASAAPASALTLGGMKTNLGGHMPMTHVGKGPTFQYQNSGRHNGPQTKPPAWKPTFTDKAGPLNDYLSKNQPLSEAGDPGFMMGPPKYSYPGRPQRPPRKPRTLSESGKKLNEHLSSSGGAQFYR